MPLHSNASPQHRALHRCVAAQFLSPLNIRTADHFSLQSHLATLSSPSLFFFSVCRFLALDRPPWLHGSQLQPKDSDLAQPRGQHHPFRKVHFPGGRVDLPRVPVQSFVHPGTRFPTSNAFFNFTIQNRGWQTLYAPLVPGVAPVVQEFHSNLPFKVGTTVFIRGKWVEFSAQAINRIYRLLDDDSAEYKALFADIDYERLMQELTQGQSVWKRQPSTSDFTNF